ncbi:MAG TPA: lysylphosphatidylglycerol synthase domain-containing protein [Polyangia bacterium]|jgi:hypothetical protein|nr:lysylphosphatidylglycerol synthase domain-containing protein [Polyangia bacterium]
MRRSIATVGAWVVTAGMLAFLFWRTPLSQVVEATRAAATWTVPAALFWVAAIYLADSFAIWKTFGWFLAKLSFAQVLVVRGATYLLAAINYSVGQGAIVYFVHRATGVPVLRGVGTVLLIMGINVLALLALATVGLAIAPDVPRGLAIVVAGAFVGLLVYALGVAVKPRWLARRPIFDVLLGAGLGGHLRALAVRLPHIATLVGLQMSMLHAFGVKVPLVDAVVTLPIVFFVAVLPISVQGIGTTQAAMVLFFARFAPGDRGAQEAAVLAASLVSQAIALTFQITVGLLCLRSSVGRDLRKATRAAATPAAAPAGSFDDTTRDR